MEANNVVKTKITKIKP